MALPARYGCERKIQTLFMRILYIDIDSLRPDHLGCYGYHRNTSPAIDAIAAEGLTCERVYASDAPCLPSRTAFYSGRFGIQTGVVGHGGTTAQPKIEGPTRDFCDTFDSEGLAGKLQKLGYHTAMVSPFGQRHAAWHFYAGFNEIHNTGMYGDDPAEIVQPVVDRWLATNANSDNWFLHINFWDPHGPYRTPAEYGEPFADDPLPEWITDEVLASHIKTGGPHSALDIGMYSDQVPAEFPRFPGSITDRASLRKVIDGYDTGIRYVDDQVATIIAALKQAGVYDDTLIIISADHGENQGELGIYVEHGTADEITCHVPLIIKHPKGVSGQRDAALHYHLDLAPTLMDLLDGEPSPLWDGRSFAETIRSGTGSGREELILSQCAHVCQRSVRWDQWLYIRTYHDGFHLFPTEMLFDIENDPHEQHNLADSRPDLAREGLWRLSRWHDEQMHRLARNASDATDPLWTVVREGGPFHARLTNPGHPVGGIEGLKAYLKRLENTGRSDFAQKLREKYLT